MIGNQFFLLLLAMASAQTYDTIVVGSGVSGLIAAYNLNNAGQNVFVLEAKDRIGGRTWSVQLNSINGSRRWDLGGQWVGNTQPHVLRLLDTLNLQLYEQITTDSMDKSNFVESIDFIQMAVRLESNAEDISPNDPIGDSTKALEYANKTFLAWCIDASFTKNGATQFAEAITAPMDVRADDVSMAFVSMYLNSAGCSITNFLEDTDDAAQRYRIVNGAMSIAESLASSLPERSIKLSSPVIKIEHNNDNVTVTTKDNHTYKAKHVIIAIPPSQAARIQYVPLLSRAKLQLLTNYKPRGHATSKFVATYDMPYWRMGEKKEFTSEADNAFFVDATLHDGTPAIIGFIHLNHSAMVDADQRRATYLNVLVKLFGQQMANPIDLKEAIWSQVSYIEGAVASLAPGHLTPTYPRDIRERTGLIHWAGTETATVWMGYINGAVQAGERAANEVLGRAGDINNNKNHSYEFNDVVRILGYTMGALLNG